RDSARRTGAGRRPAGVSPRQRPVPRTKGTTRVLPLPAGERVGTLAVRGSVAQAERVTAVWTRVRAEARTRAKSMIVLALIVGLAGGVALTAFAAARRTASAVARSRADRAHEVMINAAGGVASGLRVGSHLRRQGWVPGQEDELLKGSDVPPTGPIVDVRVVGVGRFPSELSTTPATPGVTYTGSNFL